MAWCDGRRAGLREHDQFVCLCVEQLAGAALSYSTLKLPIVTLVRYVCDQQVEVPVIRRVRDSAIQILYYNDLYMYVHAHLTI